MTVYIEIIFVSNFFIDLFLCVFCLAVTKRKAGTVRIILSAAFGGLVSAIYPFIGSYGYIIKGLCAVIMIIIIAPGKKFVDYITTLLTFLAITFLLGGMVEFFIDAIDAGLNYYDFTYGALPIIVCVCLTVVVRLWEVVKKELVYVRQKNSLYSYVVLRSADFEKKCRAFYDSGNRVYANNGEPVIFVTEQIYNRLTAQEESSVCVMTQNGASQITIRKALLEVYCREGENIIYQVSVGKLSSGTLLDAEILLHSDMQGAHL